MYIFVILALFGMAFAADFFGGAMKTVTSQDLDQARVEALAYNMAIYQEAARRWVVGTGDRPAHLDYTGFIPDAELVDRANGYVPLNYRNMGSWIATRAGSGEVLVYPHPSVPLPSGVDARMLARKVSELKGGSDTVGYVSTQTIRTAKSNFSVPLPAGTALANNTVVMIAMVR